MKRFTRRACKVALGSRRGPALPGLALALLARIDVIQVGHQRLWLHLGRSRGLSIFEGFLIFSVFKGSRRSSIQADMLGRQTLHAFLHAASL